MKLPISGNAQQYAVLLGVGAVVAIGIYLFAKREVGEAVKGVGGIVSGNNAVTRGTVYEGAGVLGTLGAATNSASGGVFERVGEWLGGSIYDLTHADPNAAVKQASSPTSVTVIDRVY